MDHVSPGECYVTLDELQRLSTEFGEISRSLSDLVASESASTDEFKRRIESNNYKIGQRICEERKKRNLLQIQFAEMVGISNTHMGAIERGEYPITSTILQKIAIKLGIEVDCLLSDSVAFEPTDDEYINQFREMIQGRPREYK